jgi:hypothetical protein
MFGNVAACRHTLGAHHRGWMAALCGTCLAVRDGSGQLSRALVTTDAVAAAVLAHEVGGVAAGRRTAGPCPARGMLPASVWTGPAAAVGAAVSLLAAGIALDDKVADGDLPGGRLLRRPAGRWAARIVGDGVALAEPAGLDAGAIVAAQERSRAVERVRPADLAAWCAPVEDAFAAAFAPVGLDGVGAAVGRVTLLADAVADRADDERAGAPNPILAGACDADEAMVAVDRDLRFVAAAVAAARPGSLSAALWGPAWRCGVERAMGLVHVCAPHPARRSGGVLAGAAAIGAVGVAMAPTSQWGGGPPGPFGAGGQPSPSWGPQAGVGQPLPGYGAPPPGGGRRRRRHSSESGCDGCDCCCCACCCCDAADCC